MRFGVEIKGNFNAAMLQKNEPKAEALALTKLVQIGQTSVQKNLPREFTVRGPWWKKRNKFGIKIVPAEKEDRPVAAEVGTDADWLTLHETAKRKRARRGGRVAIPTRNVRRTQRGIKRATEKPRRLKRSFVGKRGKAKGVLFKIVGRGKGRRVVPMYLLRKSARIEFNSPVIDPARMAIHLNVGPEFQKAMSKVFRPRRRRRMP